ncbi:efflux RND transporter periplasmic adaptor subunit [Candidatus Nitrospira bockiana]
MSMRLSRLADVGLGLTLGLLLFSGCDAPPEASSQAKTTEKELSTGLVRLTAEEAKAAGVVVEPVIRGEFRSYRDFPGTVEPDQHALAEITTLVRGRVVDVYADLGQEVKGGQLLAMLYSSELGMAQSAYLKANAKLYVAERSYERAKSLLQEKVIGLAEAQRREGEMISLRAEKREASDRLRLLGMSEEELQRLDREQTIRSHVPIVAPFDGRVIARNLTKGEVVETTEKLFVVADLSEVWVTANIPEKDIPFIYNEQPERQSVEVRVSAYPNEVFHGKITYVGDVLDRATRTMRLRLELPNPHRRLKPEMFATIRIYSEPENGVLMIPEAAVQRDRDRRFVFIEREPFVYEARNVSLGESNGRMIKVLDGLAEGETVVTKAAFVLKSELLGDQI